MNLVDANVLLYAVNGSEPRHQVSRDWLDEQLSGGGTVGFAWIVLLAFLRLSTKTGLYPSPLSVEEGLATLRAWLARPQSVIVQESPADLAVLDRLVAEVGSGVSLCDLGAHLAAWRSSTKRTSSASTTTSGASPESSGTDPASRAGEHGGRRRARRTAPGAPHHAAARSPGHAGPAKPLGDLSRALGRRWPCRSARPRPAGCA